MRVLRSRFSRAAHAYPVPVRHISMLHTLIRSQTLHLMPPLHILRAHMIVHSCQHHHHMLRCMAKRWQTSHLYKQRSTRPKRASPRAATYIAQPFAIPPPQAQNEALHRASARRAIDAGVRFSTAADVCRVPVGVPGALLWTVRRQPEASRRVCPIFR